MKNHPKLPLRIAMSTQVAWYPAHCHGSNSCESDGTMMTNRSNHMPRLMNSDRMNSHVVLRRRFCEKSDNGRTALQISMIHAAHHHCPKTRFHQYSFSIGLPEYQPT